MIVATNACPKIRKIDRTAQIKLYIPPLSHRSNGKTNGIKIHILLSDQSSPTERIVCNKMVIVIHLIAFQYFSDCKINMKNRIIGIHH